MAVHQRAADIQVPSHVFLAVHGLVAAQPPPMLLCERVLVAFENSLSPVPDAATHRALHEAGLPATQPAACCRRQCSCRHESLSAAEATPLAAALCGARQRTAANTTQGDYTDELQDQRLMTA